MRRDGARARDYATRHDVPRWSTSAEAVIDDESVDVVYVATPTSSHAEYAIAAARAGKHVLVEKPMAMNADQAQAMVQAADEAGVRLWVAYYRRTLPRFGLIRRLLDDGSVGDVLTVATTWRKPRVSQGWRWDPELNRAGEFFEAACHTVDALDHLLGPVHSGAGHHDRDHQAVAAVYRFGEVPGTGTFSFGAADYVEETVISGSKGSLRFSSFSPTPVRLETEHGVSEHPVQDPPHVHGPLVASILGELRGEGMCPSTGATALRTAQVMDEVLGPG